MASPAECLKMLNTIALKETLNIELINGAQQIVSSLNSTPNFEILRVSVANLCHQIYEKMASTELAVNNVENTVWFGTTAQRLFQGSASDYTDNFINRNTMTELRKKITESIGSGVVMNKNVVQKVSSEYQNQIRG